MSDVLVERHFDVAVTAADVRAVADASDGCFGIHRVQWRGSLLSTDGTRLWCHFEAPDAESVRIAMRQVGGPPAALYPFTMLGPTAAAENLDPTLVLSTHCFDDAVEASAVAARLHDCEALRSGLVRVYLSTDRRRAFCVHRSGADAAHAALRAAALAPEQLWAVRPLAP